VVGTSDVDGELLDVWGTLTEHLGARDATIAYLLTQPGVLHAGTSDDDGYGLQINSSHGETYFAGVPRVTGWWWTNFGLGQVAIFTREEATTVATQQNGFELLAGNLLISVGQTSRVFVYAQWSDPFCPVPDLPVYIEWKWRVMIEQAGSCGNGNTNWMNLRIDRGPTTLAPAEQVLTFSIGGWEYTAWYGMTDLVRVTQ
jgi:hypothetical protein